MDIYNKETSEDIKSRHYKFAVLPIGSYEQHGAHLPITTDTLISSIISRNICDSYGGLLISPITISCSHEHGGFPATISVSPETLAKYLKDVVLSILRLEDIALVVIINGHGGNYVVNNVAQELNYGSPRVLSAPVRQHWQEAMEYAGIESTISADMHAGEVETSILMSIMPDVVQIEKAVDVCAADRPLLTFYGMSHYTKNGVIGFPRKATPEKGRLLIDKITESIGKHIIEILHSMPMA